MSEFSKNEFVGVVDLGGWAAIVAEVSAYRGHQYLQLRRWNKHRERMTWYPTRTAFSLPVCFAGDLAKVLAAAGCGETGQPPDWLDEAAESYRKWKAAQDGAESGQPHRVA